MSLNKKLHLDFEELHQSILKKINNNENKDFQINHWIDDVQKVSEEVENLKRMKDLGTITVKLFVNSLFLNVLQLKVLNPQQLPIISEDQSNRDESSDSDSHNEEALTLTSFNLNERETPLIALINYLKDELELEFQNKEAETEVSAMSLASITLTTTRSIKMRQSKCYDLVQQISTNFGETGTDLEIKQLRKRHLGVLFPFLRRKLMNKALKYEIETFRNLCNLQTSLTIKNILPHKNKQEHFVQDDKDKILETFKDGFIRLNQEFSDQKLTRIDLTDDQIECLSEIFFENAKIKGQQGSHYSIEGPFILPDNKQIMSTELIIDRWVALSAFQRLYSPIE
mgnify:CR=1 FL=1